VRSNRCFRPNQIIMEYAGEIITEEECDRRMNEIYKNNDCYYLMSFDQNMIIDATTGSIARFVNHSCNPNCRMIKWIVSGQPRMALFAGDNPIMTGDELTYDYNFDPFSAKNVQGCLCGEPNCRGVLGPRPREVKVPKNGIKTIVKTTVKAGKRKIKEVIGDGEPTGSPKSKKRKIQPATGVKRKLSTASTKAAKGAATALKKGMSSITVNAKKVTKTTISSTKSPIKGKTGALAQVKKSVTKAAVTKRITTKTYGKKSITPRKQPTQQVSSRASSLTIVAKGDEVTPRKTGRKTTPTKKLAASGKLATPATGGSRKSVTKKALASKTASPRKALEISRALIRVVTTD
jgi:histone-lysine N-methyltransferase ASH1L